MSERFDRAIEAIDRANSASPNREEIRGVVRPRELAHAELASEWIERLSAPPSEALRLAARAHHLRRWELPRGDYPEGRAGYLRWRKQLYGRHADAIAEIMREVGYETPEITRVRDLVSKRKLGREPDAQALEDALCLIFLETQLADFGRKHPREKCLDVLRKTLRKMSGPARELAREVDLASDLRALLDEANLAEPANDSDDA
jgi:hypothetical protein